MQKGRSARWLSFVLRLPWHTEPRPTSVQIQTAGDPIEAAGGTVQRPVVGSYARAHAFTHIECTDIGFAKEGTAFFRLGKTQRSIAYVLSGSGTFGSEHVEPGDGALLENASGVSMHETPGVGVVVAALPQPSAASRAYHERWRFEAERVGLLAIDERGGVRAPIPARPSPRLLPFVQEQILDWWRDVDEVKRHQASQSPVAFQSNPPLASIPHPC